MVPLLGRYNTKRRVPVLWEGFNIIRKGAIPLGMALFRMEVLGLYKKGGTAPLGGMLLSIDWKGSVSLGMVLNQ